MVVVKLKAVELFRGDTSASFLAATRLTKFWAASTELTTSSNKEDDNLHVSDKLYSAIIQ